MWDEDFPRDGDVIQTLQPQPQRFGTGLTIAFATEEAAKTGHHTHGFAKTRRRTIDYGVLGAKFAVMEAAFFRR